LKNQLADLTIALADLKLALIEKDEMIKDLQAKLTLTEDMEWFPPFYWRWKNNKWEGPFCQHCFDKERVAYRTIEKDQ